jgi:hypothetical protein
MISAPPAVVSRLLKDLERRGRLRLDRGEVLLIGS